MNEELEALKDIKELFTCHDFDLLEKCSVIEKALKQAEEDRKVLDIFKNALTIEHCPISIEPLKGGEDFVGSLVKNITTIRTNELDKNLRETLREWVLKNAFPKEMQALNEILALHDKWLGN